MLVGVSLGHCLLNIHVQFSPSSPPAPSLSPSSCYSFLPFPLLSLSCGQVFLALPLALLWAHDCVQMWDEGRKKKVCCIQVFPCYKLRGHSHQMWSLTGICYPQDTWESPLDSNTPYPSVPKQLFCQLHQCPRFVNMGKRLSMHGGKP